MDLIDRIRARRDELAAQLQQGQAQYADLEQTLALLQRNLDAMHGGIQELKALLAHITSATARDDLWHAGMFAETDDATVIPE